jgi:endonuclease III
MPEAIARLGIPRIEAIIRPCGLAPAKARHIRGLSRILETAAGAPVSCPREWSKAKLSQYVSSARERLGEVADPSAAWAGGRVRDVADTRTV